MGYGNRPAMPNNNYQKGGFNKNHNTKFQSNKPKNYNTGIKDNNKSLNDSFKKNNGFTFKSDDDIYSPKVYAKKPKEKSMFDDIIIPEYLEDRQRMRNKRANDKKYKNKNRRDY
jgi:hypothetical protein